MPAAIHARDLELPATVLYSLGDAGVDTIAAREIHTEALKEIAENKTECKDAASEIANVSLNITFIQFF